MPWRSCVSLAQIPASLDVWSPIRRRRYPLPTLRQNNSRVQFLCTHAHESATVRACAPPSPSRCPPPVRYALPSATATPLRSPPSSPLAPTPRPFLFLATWPPRRHCYAPAPQSSRSRFVLSAEGFLRHWPLPRRGRELQSRAAAAVRLTRQMPAARRRSAMRFCSPHRRSSAGEGFLTPTMDQ